MARLCSETQHHGALPIKWVALALLLLPLCGEAQNQATEESCTKICPTGFKCDVQRKCFTFSIFWTFEFCFNAQICVELSLPPSCEDVSCPGSSYGSPDVCVLGEGGNCTAPPCQPEPVCIFDACKGVSCYGPGHVCEIQYVGHEPGEECEAEDCRFRGVCVPRARPRPGFCRPAALIGNVTTSQCEFDRDCPSTLLCCPTETGTTKCAAPAFPNPCDSIQCPPPDRAAPTCVLTSNGTATCADPECVPDSFHCSDGKQAYCTDQGVFVQTNVSITVNCTL